MDPTFRMLAGIGLGAGLMYLLDPDRGRARRARLRDQATRFVHQARDAADVVSRDAANRTRGVFARMHAPASPPPDDRTLTERVRSQLGHCVSHPRAITVTALNGTVTLQGVILADEVSHMVSCLGRVPGVRALVNQLEAHPEAAHHPLLQGGRRSGPRRPVLQENWSPTLRFVAGSVGLGLMSYCLAQRDLVAVLLGTAGFGLFLRAAGNVSLNEAVREMIPAPPVAGPSASLAVAAAGP